MDELMRMLASVDLSSIVEQGPWALLLWLALRHEVKRIRKCILETTRAADEAMLMRWKNELKRHSRRMQAIERRLGVVDNPNDTGSFPTDPTPVA